MWAPRHELTRARGGFQSPTWVTGGRPLTPPLSRFPALYEIAAIPTIPSNGRFGGYFIPRLARVLHSCVTSC